jgi:tRNA-dihydrouridine synthase B
MIGRAAQGNPWIFKQIDHFLKTGKDLEKPTASDIHSTLLTHLEQLYSFYGNLSGVRIARKHIGWYFKHFDTISLETRSQLNQAISPTKQLALINSTFNHIH